jgi:hypothetical protein
MSVVEKLQRAKFIVDVEGNKTAALDYALWEEAKALPDA